MFIWSVLGYTQQTMQPVVAYIMKTLDCHTIKSGSRMVQQKNVGFLLIDTHYSNSFRFFLTRKHIEKQERWGRKEMFASLSTFLLPGRNIFLGS